MDRAGPPQTRDDDRMKRIRIVHKTEYHYNQPVTFGPHRAMLRPREGHDMHIVGGRLDLEPAPTVRWLRDIYGNSIAILNFAEPSRKLGILGEVDVHLRDDDPIECLIAPTARDFPFQYAPEEQLELVVYRFPAIPTRVRSCRSGSSTYTAPVRPSVLSISSTSSIVTSTSHSNTPAARIPGCSCPAIRSRAAADRVATSRS